MRFCPSLLVVLVLGCHDPAAKVDDARPRLPTDATQRAHDVESLVRRWNAAVNAHDAEQLAALYADSVELYGTRMSRTAALAAKTGSFAKHVRDELSDIAVTPAGHAQFHKKSTATDGKVIDVAGYLDARESGGQWRIVSEGDTTTDTNLESAKASRCIKAVMDVVYATTEAQTAIRDIEEGAKSAPADDPVSVGGMVNPTVDPADAGERPTWTVAICENHKDRMPCYHYFEVDTKTGRVTDSLAETDAGPLKTDPKRMARAKEACQ
jgi:ketosteroid isomerase-like protein